MSFMRIRPHFLSLLFFVSCSLMVLGTAASNENSNSVPLPKIGHEFVLGLIPRVFHWRARTRLAWGLLILYETIVSAGIGFASALLQAHTATNKEPFWIPDLSFGYSPSSLHELLDGFGGDGRRLFLGIEAWDSFVYMQGYTILLASLLQWSTGPQPRQQNKATLLSMLPWVVWFIDQLENSGQVFCTMRFDPQQMSKMWTFAATFAATANKTKWSLFAVNVVAIIVNCIRRKLATSEHKVE